MPYMGILGRRVVNDRTIYFGLGRPKMSFLGQGLTFSTSFQASKLNQIPERESDSVLISE